MKNVLLLAGMLGAFGVGRMENQSEESEAKEVVQWGDEYGTMELGSFSVSLAVKDIGKSLEFYEKLGFEKMGGVREQNWLILQNGSTTIGLFQGMFEDNIMTFNPGWDPHGKHPKKFTDIRELQAKLKEHDLTLMTEAKADTKGPANFTLQDPDGNMIFFDQHR